MRMNQIAEIVIDPVVWKVPLTIFGATVVIAFFYWIYIGITWKMAKSRHRDPLGWVLLSILVSPPLTWIILLIAGKKAI